MRKIYKKPLTEMVVIDTTHLMESSPLRVYSNDTEGVKNNDEVLSREAGSWED